MSSGVTDGVAAWSRTTYADVWKQISSAQKMASDAQIEKMEKELAKMRAGLTESVQLMEQREINTNIE